MKLLLIDASSFIHRAYHALPPLSDNEGNPTGALYGLTNTLIKILKDENPEYVVAALDLPEKTFRDKIYEDYKAHRPETPDDLKKQLKRIKEVFNGFNIKTLGMEGFEADDVIATVVDKFKNNKNIKLVVLTGDLDMVQLVEDDQVVAMIPKRGVSDMVIYNEDEVEKKFGIPPKKIAEYKGLVGDKSDNIPGVPGIGPKTAVEMIKKYGNIGNTYKNLKDKEVSKKVEKSFLENKDKALLSKKLAELHKNIPLEIKLEDLSWKMPENKEIEEMFKKFGFKTLIKRLSDQDSLL